MESAIVSILVHKLRISTWRLQSMKSSMGPFHYRSHPQSRPGSWFTLVQHCLVYQCYVTALVIPTILWNIIIPMRKREIRRSDKSVSCLSGRTWLISEFSLVSTERFPRQPGFWVSTSPSSPGKGKGSSLLSSHQTKHIGFSGIVKSSPQSAALEQGGPESLWARELVVVWEVGKLDIYPPVPLDESFPIQGHACAEPVSFGKWGSV